MRTIITTLLLTLATAHAAPKTKPAAVVAAEHDAKLASAKLRVAKAKAAAAAAADKLAMAEAELACLQLSPGAKTAQCRPTGVRHEPKAPYLADCIRESVAQGMSRAHAADSCEMLAEENTTILTYGGK